MWRKFRLAIERFILHLSYFLYKVDEHSLQAPFAYSFFQLIKQKKNPPLQKIEDERNAFLKSKKSIPYSTFGNVSSLGKLKKSQIASIAKYGISDDISSRILASIIQKFNCKTVIELGTSLGINASYMAATCLEGKIYTFEGHPVLCELSRELFERLHYHNIQIIEGNISETLPKFLSTVNQIDFVFIDANHTSKALIEYFQWINTKLTPKSIVIIDDIRWNRDMHFGWKTLLDHATISHSFDIGNMGILFFKEGVQQQHYIL